MNLFSCWDTNFHSNLHFGVLQIDMLGEPSVNWRRVPLLVAYRNLGLGIILEPIRRILEGRGKDGENPGMGGGKRNNREEEGMYQCDQCAYRIKSRATFLIHVKVGATKYLT